MVQSEVVMGILSQIYTWSVFFSFCVLVFAHLREYIYIYVSVVSYA